VTSILKSNLQIVRMTTFYQIYKGLTNPPLLLGYYENIILQVLFGFPSTPNKQTKSSLFEWVSSSYELTKLPSVTKKQKGFFFLLAIIHRGGLWNL